MAIPITQGWGVSGTEPIDNRIVFNTDSDFLSTNSFNNTYVGLVIFIISENALKVLTSKGNSNAATLSQGGATLVTLVTTTGVDFTSPFTPTAISGAFNGQTGSFLTTSPFTPAAISGAFNGQTGSFLTSSPFTAPAISGAFNGQTGSFLTSSPFTPTAISGAFNGVTSSFSNIKVIGHITASGEISASSAIFTGNVDAETFSLNGLNFVSTDVLIRSGSTIFSGSVGETTHQFTGSILITGSLSLPGISDVSQSISNISFTSPFTPTAISGAFNGVTSSFLTTSPFTPTAISGAFNGQTGSFLTTSPFTPTAISGAFNGQTGSFLTSSTNLSEFTFNSIVVSNTDIVYSASYEQFQVQKDDSELWVEAPQFMFNSTLTKSLMDDGGENSTIAEFNVGGTDSAFNVIFDFNEPKIISQFRHTFTFRSDDNTILGLPKEIFIYGKNTPFSLRDNGVNDGTLLGTGANPANGSHQGFPTFFNFPSSNPISILSLGDSSNLRRTSSIPETSLTSSFRYYRIRYNQALDENAAKSNNIIAISELTPISRSFQTGTSISASNGVLSATQIISNNFIGTSSFALNSDIALSSSYALTASFVDGLTGTFTNPTLTNPTLLNNTVITGSLIITSSDNDGNPANATGNLTVAGIFHLGTITDVETKLNNVSDLADIGVSLIPNNDSIEDINTGESNISLGDNNHKWSNIFAKNTFFGGIHEINLKTEGIDKMQEGTVLILKNGIMQPCEIEADPLVMGIVPKKENYPIVLGAELVLITGDIEEGDYIITSNIRGHGKGINPKYIYERQLFGKIIAQAIESGKGESYTIRAMIRKM